jgi:FSR family fosmidomycin resistance protein-like MFS transporter
LPAVPQRLPEAHIGVDLTVTAAPATPHETAASKRQERKTLAVAGGAHALHDGFTDLIWIALPIWQAEFGLSYAAAGALRTVFSGTMASLQIPSSMLAEKVGPGLVLAVGTALAGLCYCLASMGSGFWWLIGALLLGGIGAATQHPIGSAMVAHAFAGSRSLKALGAYNFSGDVGKVLLPATASALILIMPWRPAYGLLGLVGILAAVAIFLLTPRFAFESEPADTKAAGTAEETAAQAAETARMKTGFRALVALGIVDSITRGGFFVLLPFVLTGKGAQVSAAGFALTLVFFGGAFGKLACGWFASRFGKVFTIAMSKVLTAVGMAAILLLPFELDFVLLPFFGVIFNGVTTVTYGSVPDLVTPQRRTRAFSIFYTVTLGFLAAAPPASGYVGDLIGIPGAVMVVAALSVVTVPLAFLIKFASSDVRLYQ